MSLDEAIYTTRAMRRLRTDPVPPGLLSYEEIMPRVVNDGR